jgi:hypothetical protein
MFSDLLKIVSCEIPQNGAGTKNRKNVRAKPAYLFLVIP